MNIEPTATHLPVFDALFREQRIVDVLEFGCGLFSTKKFHDMGCRVTSIEMQHREWAENIQQALPAVDVRLALGAHAWRELAAGLNPRYDLIFVDGHGDSRPDCLMWAKERADLIVAHDTEHPYYKWERADMSGFDVQVFKALRPWTTVWRRS